jgi:hypothetical protein
MNIHRLLYGEYSKFIISVILGFGLATLFRFSCDSIDCVKFVGPPPSILKSKVFKYEDGCMNLKHKPVKCNDKLKKVRFQNI